MATKKRATASGSRGAEGGGQREMPDVEMNRPVKEGLMEMPTGGEMHGGGATRGAQPATGLGMQGGLMPGESPGGTGGQSESDMPGGGMEST